MQMDIWYELAIREMSDVDVNEAASELRREAEAALEVPPAEDDPLAGDDDVADDADAEEDA